MSQLLLFNTLLLMVFSLVYFRPSWCRITLIKERLVFCARVLSVSADHFTIDHQGWTVDLYSDPTPEEKRSVLEFQALARTYLANRRLSVNMERHAADADRVAGMDDKEH